MTTKSCAVKTTTITNINILDKFFKKLKNILMGFSKEFIVWYLLGDNYQSNERAGSRHKDNGKESHISQHYNKYQVTPSTFYFSIGKTKPKQSTTFMKKNLYIFKNPVFFSSYFKSVTRNHWVEPYLLSLNHYSTIQFVNDIHPTSVLRWKCPLFSPFIYL